MLFSERRGSGERAIRRKTPRPNVCLSVPLEPKSQRQRLRLQYDSNAPQHEFFIDTDCSRVSTRVSPLSAHDGELSRRATLARLPRRCVLMSDDGIVTSERLRCSRFSLGLPLSYAPVSQHNLMPPVDIARQYAQIAGRSDMIRVPHQYAIVLESGCPGPRENRTWIFPTVPRRLVPSWPTV